MASVSTDANGNRRLVFTGLDRRRRTVYLGNVSARGADDLKRLIEEHSRSGGLRCRPVTRRLRNGLKAFPMTCTRKLVAVGLCEPEGDAAA